MQQAFDDKAVGSASTSGKINSWIQDEAAIRFQFGTGFAKSTSVRKQFPFDEQASSKTKGASMESILPAAIVCVGVIAAGLLFQATVNLVLRVLDQFG